MTSSLPREQLASTIPQPVGAEGVEWIVDAFGCDPGKLLDRGAVEAACDALIADLGLHVVGQSHWHLFPGPGGMTALYLLSESHLALHTFPEHGTASFNLYCCVERPEWPWEERLASLLGARRVTVRRVARGSAP